MSDLDAIKRAAEQRADADCEVGLANLEARISLVDEYAVSGDATGKRLLVPERALMTGMAEHLRTAMRYRMARRVMLSALAVAFLLAAPTSAGAQQDLHGGGGGRAPLLVPNTQQVNDTLRALDRLARYGYSVGTPVRAERAIRAWERSNGLMVDGLVGPKVLASLNLTATASVPAVRVDPPVAASDPPVGDVCAEMSAYRQAAGLPEVFDAIGYRESRCRNDVTSSTGCCFGWLQVFLASSMRAPGYRDGVQACGVNSVDDIRGDSDTAKRGQMCVAKVMFDVSGLGPWQ